MGSPQSPDDLVRPLVDRVVPALGPTGALHGVTGLLARRRRLDPGTRQGRSADRVASILSPREVRRISDTPLVLGWLWEALMGRDEIPSIADRRDLGCFYTPPQVVSAIVGQAVRRPLLSRLSRRLSRGALDRSQLVEEVEGYRVCDPAMGAGFFLVAVLDVLEDVVTGLLARMGGPRRRAPAHLRARLARSCLRGMEIDGEAVRLARTLVWIASADPTLRLEDLEPTLVEADALIDRPPDGADGDPRFDVVVGNPPYGAVLPPGTRRHVSRSYETGRGGVRNTALHFIERSRDLTRPGGWIGLVVPKSLAYSLGWRAGVRIVLPGLAHLLDASVAFPGVRLEQVVLVFKNGKLRSRTYASGELRGGRPKLLGRVPRASWDQTGALLPGCRDEDLEIQRRVADGSVPLGRLSRSFRGLGIQALEDPSGDVEAISGRDIARWTIRSPLRRFSLPGDRPERIARLTAGDKIVSQNVVAHVTRPVPRILLTSAMDTRRLVTLDTVTNTVVTDPDIDPWFVLAVLNSEFASWYAHRFIFSGAIRTMHLDAGYVSRIPIPGDVTASLVERASGLAREVASLGAGNERRRDRDVSELERLVRRCFGLDGLDVSSVSRRGSLE